MISCDPMCLFHQEGCFKSRSPKRTECLPKSTCPLEMFEVPDWKISPDVADPIITIYIHVLMFET